MAAHAEFAEKASADGSNDIFLYDARRRWRSDMSFRLSVPVLRALVALRRYSIEAFFTAALMFSIEVFLVALEHPAYPLHRLLWLPWMRRTCMGVLMGLVVALICASPWGKRSGAHFNPAVTLAFWSLDKIKTFDAVCYVLVQFLGALVGVVLAASWLGQAMEHPAVDFAVTMVGRPGTAWAFVAECGMSFLLMGTILWASTRPRLGAYTPALAGILIALFVALESPLSGMSINPTRTLSSAIVAGHLERFWLYCAAPISGMLAAAGIYRLRFGRRFFVPPSSPS